MRIQRYDQTVKIWASANDTYKWANRIHESWPCSTISGKRLFIETDKGDLIDLAVNGKQDKGDIDGYELSAFINDILKEIDLK